MEGMEVELSFNETGGEGAGNGVERVAEEVTLPAATVGAAGNGRC